MKKVTIITGPQGSGKSTEAERILQEQTYWTMHADDFKEQHEDIASLGTELPLLVEEVAEDDLLFFIQNNPVDHLILIHQTN